MKKNNSFIFAIIGTIITGFAIGCFLTPNKIVGGGVSGISTIIYYSFGIAPGINFFILNMIFVGCGLKVLRKDFIIKTLIGVTLLSVFTQVFTYFPIKIDNCILATLFGGALYGFGIGISFAAGSSTGGTDILGRIVQSKFSYVPIGKILLFVDGFIILISFMVFKDIELILYGILTLFISTYSIDYIISKLNVSRIAFVITDKGKEISDKLVSTSPRGVTLIDVRGAYSNKDKKMLFCALKDSECEQFQKKILEIDDVAFIVFSEAQRIKGNGFYLYK